MHYKSRPLAAIALMLAPMHVIAAPTAQCDGKAHLLKSEFQSLHEAQAIFPAAGSLDEEMDQAAIESDIRRLLEKGGGVLRIPLGTCLFTSSVVISLKEGDNLSIVGQELGSKISFSGGVDGFIIHIPALKAANTPLHRTPVVLFSDLVFMTSNSYIGNTAISVLKLSPKPGGSYANAPALRARRLRFEAADGGAGNGLNSGWSVGVEIVGLSDTEISDSQFVGGVREQDSSFVVYRAALAPQQSVTHRLVRNEMDYGGTAISIGQPCSGGALQGFEVDALTTVGNAHDISASFCSQTQGAGDWMSVTRSNFGSKYGSIISYYNTVSWQGNYCLVSQGACLTVVAGRRHLISNNIAIGASPVFVLDDVIGDITGSAVISNNIFSNLQKSPVFLKGKTANVIIGENSNTNPGVPLAINDNKAVH